MAIDNECAISVDVENFSRDGRDSLRREECSAQAKRQSVREDDECQNVRRSEKEFVYPIDTLTHIRLWLKI
jgi:hypothetical protein